MSSSKCGERIPEDSAWESRPDLDLDFSWDLLEDMASLAGIWSSPSTGSACEPLTRTSESSTSSFESSSSTASNASERFSSMGINVRFNMWTPTTSDDEFLSSSPSAFAGSLELSSSTSSSGLPRSSTSPTPSQTESSSSSGRSSPGLPRSSTSPTPSLTEPAPSSSCGSSSLGLLDQRSPTSPSPDHPAYGEQWLVDFEFMLPSVWSADSLDWGIFGGWSPVPDLEEAELIQRKKEEEMKVVHARAAEKRAARKRAFIAMLQMKRSLKLNRRGPL